jgi:hypothetical protein
MKPNDRDLQRLLAAAAQAPREAPVEVPFTVECRILALWRAGAGRDDALFGLLPLFRRACVLACVLALLALAFNFRELAQPPSDEVVIINSAVALTEVP